MPENFEGVMIRIDQKSGVHGESSVSIDQYPSDILFEPIDRIIYVIRLNPGLSALLQKFDHVSSFVAIASLLTIECSC